MLVVSQEIALAHANTLLREFDALRYPERHQLEVRLFKGITCLVKSPEYELQGLSSVELQAKFIEDATFRPLVKKLGGKAVGEESIYHKVTTICQQSLHHLDAEAFGVNTIENIDVSQILPPPTVIQAMFKAVVRDNKYRGALVEYIEEQQVIFG